GAGAAASALTFRPAQFSDLEAIVGVIVAAMPSDPQWDWRFPRRREYADDTRAFTSAKYHEFLSDKDAWHVMVAESDDSARPHVCRARMIVAVAVWDQAAMQCPPSEPLLLPSHKRRDGHRRRMELWAATMAKARKQYFDDSFGARHLQLQILATHPDYQRRGAGTALCKWGMAFAQKWGMVVTVFASPMGKKLYRRLGFQTMARIEMRVPDEMESVAPVAMSYE
ncbi:acyl-CoA N-acyltransferase, partial [Trichodelitschia bisporula]